ELVDKLADADEPGIRVRRILRLGKRVAGIHRPLKIVFENADAPKHLLSRAWIFTSDQIWIHLSELSSKPLSWNFEGAVLK
ncbi:hypothetical protein X801_06376, partial [Opisthorchis viverrini]